MTRTANIQDIKRANRNTLYRAIYEKPGSTRPELAARVQASLPTVIHNVRSLLEDGLIREDGTTKSTGGRKAAQLHIVPEARAAIGVDVALDRYVVTVVTLDGSIRTLREKSIPWTVGDEYLRDLGESVDLVAREAGISEDALLGVGVSIPGILSQDGRSLNSHALSLNEYPLGPMIDALGRPCLFSNDANAAATAEAWVAGLDRSFVYLSLKNLVGGAFILNGKPLSGENLRCGEFGHMTVERGGLQCYCGKKGCLDSYCSALNLSDRGDGDVAEFFRLVEADDPVCRRVWNNYLDYLATAVNSLRMVLDYDIVLGGSAGAAMEPYIDDLRRRVAVLDTFDTVCQYVTACRYKVEPSAVGAALMHVDAFIASV